MADGKQWFKVWASILTDPDMEDQHNQIIGIWTRLGALVSQHGEKGIIKMSLSQFKRKTHLYEADDVTMQRIFNALKKINLDIFMCNDEVTVTFKKWHKYQVDNSAERVANYRKNVTVQEEKRREEKRIRKEVKSPSQNPADFLTALKANPAYKGIDLEKELSKMDAWLLTPKGKGRKKTPRFILNWLNKIETAMPEETKRLADQYQTL